LRRVDQINKFLVLKFKYEANNQNIENGTVFQFVTDTKKL